MPFLTRHDLRTNYQLLGPGLTRDRTPVALIHGLGANLAFWYLGAAPLMGQDRPLLMHDLRGHGASSMPPDSYRLEHLAEDFRHLLDDLGVERAHVVGHSHGARVALAFALAHPGRVASLTLADTQLRALQPPMRLGDWPHWARWKSDLAAQGVESFPDDDAEIDFRVLAQLGPRGRARPEPEAVHRPEPEAVQQALPEAVQRALPSGAARPLPEPESPAGGFRARLMAARAQGRPLLRGTEPAASELPARIDLRSRQMGARSSRQWQTLLEKTSAGQDLDDESRIVPGDLGQLTMPSLLIYGEVSHCVPTSERLLEMLPDARRILVPGAGHFFPLVKPRLFARALRMFVAGVESETPAETAPRRGRLAARLRAARNARQGGQS